MEIKITAASGKTYTVPAYRTAVPELAVHRRLGYCGVPIKGAWDVTHIPTGLKLTGFYISTRALAKAFADHLTHLAWDFNAASIPKGEAFKLYGKGVREARETIAA